MRKNQSPAPKTVDEMEAEVSDLLRAIETERRALRPAILAGDDTAAIRARIVAIEAKLADCRARIDQLFAARVARRAADVALGAAELAGKIVSAVNAKIAALDPPQHPTK